MNNRLRNKLSINTYLTIVIIVVVTTIVALYSAISYFDAKEKIEGDIRERSETTLSTLQRSVVNYIEAYAVNEYEELIRSEMEQEDLQAIIIKDRYMGKVLGQDFYITGFIRGSDRIVVDFDPANPDHTTMLQQCYFKLTSPITRSGLQKGSPDSEIGQIVVCHSDKVIAEELSAIVSENVQYAITISIFLILLLLITIRRIVLKPITQMVSSLVESDEKGMLMEPVSARGPKEIAVLSSRMNGMLEAVRNREKELKESESRFRNLIESAPDGIFIADIDGHYTDVNSAGCDLLGYERNELIGKTIMDIIPPEDVSRLFDSKDEMMEGVTNISEWTLIHKDGSPVAVEVSANILSRGEWRGFVRDISGRKQAEERIRRYFQAMEQSGEAIVISDADGVIEHVNPAFTEITGYSEEESVGQKTNILKSDHQEASIYQEMWATITAGNTWRGKVINKKKSGEFYPAMLTISPIMNDDGEVSRYIGIQQNLEKMEALEAQFRQSQKMEAIGTLVGGIAHDFNNTLAGMTGNLYLARRDAAQLPKVVERLQSVEKLAFSAAATIQQMLTFSRKGAVEMSSVKIASFLKESMKLQRASIPENIDLKIDVVDSDMSVKCDVNQLQQVVMNLLNNAAHAVKTNSDPSIVLRLERFEADASFLSTHQRSRKGEYAHISVVDNGCGIKKEHLDHIFDPFFTTKAPNEGTGMGLAMVYGSIQTHHGFIEVDSSQTAPSGTTFHIYLPLIKKEGVSYKVAEEKHAQQGSETILLVDDDDLVLQTGQEVLESLGYKVITAQDGAQAIQLFGQHKQEIALVILDMVMPKLSGIETLRQMMKLNPSVKAMFATGYDRESEMRDSEFSKSIAVIGKPFYIDKLSHAVRKELDEGEHD